MTYDLSELKNILLSEAEGGELIAIQPGGNYGDNLIYKGFNKFIDGLNINKIEFGGGEFRHDGFSGSVPSINPTTNVRWVLNQMKYLRKMVSKNPSAIYIHGGGNFNDLWNIGIQCYRSACRYFDCPIIIGPQSVKFDSTDIRNVFESCGNQTYLFCRENQSYNLIHHMTKELENLDTYIEDDTAFYLRNEDLSDEKNKDLSDNENNYTLLSFRSDQESCRPTIERVLDPPIRVQDISKSAESLSDFVTIARNAKKIYTDRLHVAILGTILGKNISFYDNSYHKNRGVYELSLHSNPNVQFQYLR